MWVDQANVNWGGCHVGSLAENRPLLSGKIQKLYPRGDFVVSQMEINKIDQIARESALSKIKLKPTSGWPWLLSSRNRSVLGS